MTDLALMRVVSRSGMRSDPGKELSLLPYFLFIDDGSPEQPLPSPSYCAGF